MFYKNTVLIIITLIMCRARNRLSKYRTSLPAGGGCSGEVPAVVAALEASRTMESGVPLTTKPASILTPRTIGSRSRNTNCGMTRRRHGNTANGRISAFRARSNSSLHANEEQQTASRFSSPWDNYVLIVITIAFAT